MNNKPLTILASSLCLMACQEQESKQNPNIIFILVDDMGFSDLGCYGGEIKTPNLDYLGEQGMRFTQFTNSAKSFPSRANLLTGLYAHQVGMGQRPDSLRNSVTLGEVLQAAGYRTLMTGKHHGKENMFFRGFDRYYGLRDGTCNYFNPGERRPGEPEPAHKTWAKPRHWCIDEVTYAPYTPEYDDFYTTDYFTRYAMDYLDEYRDEGKPFFLYLSYIAPHDPLQAWPDDIARYEGVYDAGYEAIRQKRYHRMREMGLIDETWQLSEPTYEDWDDLSDEERADEIRRMQVYAAMIDRVDQNVGWLLDKLREIGAYDNTIILFSSDNGGSPGIFPSDGIGYSEGAAEGEIGSMERWASLGTSWSNVCNTPYRFYKDWPHYGGSCSPFIVYWPGKIKPGISDYPGHFIDVMPTFLDWTGAVYPMYFRGDTIPALEGESFADVLTGKKSARETPIFWQFQNGKAVRKGDFRLVWESHTVITDPVDYAEGPDDRAGHWVLYDMRSDKSELTNVADQYPEQVEALKELYFDWYERMMQYPQLEMATIRR